MRIMLTYDNSDGQDESLTIPFVGGSLKRSVAEYEKENKLPEGIRMRRYVRITWVVG